MTKQQILANSIITDIDLLKRDAQAFDLHGMIKEIKRIVDKVKSYSLIMVSEEGSEEYPLGGMIEPYDIEREN